MFEYTFVECVIWFSPVLILGIGLFLVKRSGKTGS
jgi:hypothetical protein